MKRIKNIFPKKCILCGRHTVSGYPLCRDCEEKLVIIEEPVCEQCGLPLAGEKTLCTKCRITEFSFKSNKSLFIYRDINRIILHQYKFSKNISLARFFAQSILLSFEDPGKNVFFIPVPGSRRKRREKGWDQISEIAKIVKREGGWSLQDCLGKIDCVQQKELDFAKRQKNLKDKFYIRKKINLEGVDCILFDDVYTTGATIESCAKVLRSAGSGNINAITLFRD